jgi:hypothetical protein
MTSVSSISTRQERVNNVGNFEKALRTHDWFYDYSDDMGVWSRGLRERQALQKQANTIQCPFSLNELRLFVHEMILENFEERKPGEYYRKGETSKYCAPAQLSNLIPQSKADAIQVWLDTNDK